MKNTFLNYIISRIFIFPICMHNMAKNVTINAYAEKFTHLLLDSRILVFLGAAISLSFSSEQSGVAASTGSEVT